MPFRRRYRIPALASLGALLGLLAGAAHAQCVGFSDVPAADPFCPNIEWIKNRGVTLGCGQGVYCPANPVMRNQMAAFMNRLGLALTPAPIRVNAHSGAVDLTASAVVCPLASDIAPATYPRTLSAAFYLTGQASSQLGVAANLVTSIDGGVTWLDLPTSVPMRNETTAAGWMQISVVGNLDLDVGAGVRLGARLTRTGGGSGNFSDSYCQFAVEIMNRNPSTPPY